MARKIVKSNPARKTASHWAASELQLYAVNTSELIPKRMDIEKGLEKKISQGKYDSKKAPAAWLHWMDDAAKRYHKEFKGSGHWFEMFNKPTRECAAKMVSKDWEASEEFKYLKQKHYMDSKAKKAKARKKAAKKKSAKKNPARACARPAGRMTAAQRRKLPARAFVFPAERKFPLYTIERFGDGKPVPSRFLAGAAIAYAKKGYKNGKLSKAKAERVIKKAEKIIAECRVISERKKAARRRKKVASTRRISAHRKKIAARSKKTATGKRKPVRRKVAKRAPAKRKTARTRRNPAVLRMSAAQIMRYASL